VILSHPGVKSPANVSYGWHANPHETLFNKEGFAAFSFRAVPRVGVNKQPPGTPLVEMIAPAKGVELSVNHVRQNGYLFNVVHRKAPEGAITVRAHIPADWKEATVTSKGAVVDAGSLQTDASGNRFLEIPTVINGPDIQVSNAANIPDFSRIHRF
jgi:hypothetical protein